MSRLGNKIAAENLKAGNTYNVKRHSGEAKVEVLALNQDGVEIEIKDGGFDSGAEKFKRGAILTVPYDSQWYELKI